MAKTSPILTENRFDKALQYARRSKGIAQEQFDVVSSRTYVSSLERGMKSPTLKKVDSLAEVLGVHPVTLLTLAYLKPGERGQATMLLKLVAEQLQELDALHT